MKRIYTAADLAQAYLLSHLLARAGIDHYIANEHLLAGAGELPFPDTYPVIWLYDAEDTTQARRIVDEFERTPERDDSWRCAACGEGNPASFELCWRCGCVNALE